MHVGVELGFYLGTEEYQIGGKCVRTIKNRAGYLGQEYQSEKTLCLQVSDVVFCLNCTVYHTEFQFSNDLYGVVIKLKGKKLMKFV